MIKCIHNKVKYDMKGDNIMIRIIEDTKNITDLYDDEPIEDVIKEEKETFKSYLNNLINAQELIKEAYDLAIKYKDYLNNVKDEKTLKDLFDINNKLHELMSNIDLFSVKNESIIKIEESNQIDIQDVPWTEYLSTDVIGNKDISKEISNIFYKKTNEFSSDSIKQYVIDAINDYIESHTRGFNDENYRDSLYTKDDEKQFIDMGKQVLKIVQNMPVKIN